MREGVGEQKERETEREGWREGERLTALRMTLSSPSGVKSQWGGHDRPRALNKLYSKLFTLSDEILTLEKSRLALPFRDKTKRRSS